VARSLIRRFAPPSPEWEKGRRLRAGQNGAYMNVMAKELHHPEREQIELSAVLEALSEPTRREIVLRLLEEGESPCQAFDATAPKSNLSYHYARLREAGVTRTRPAGPYRMISVRVDDLAARFPGLLDAIVAASRAKALAE
jgi:DNA-binding transcriptional ArsR family regulator